MSSEPGDRLLDRAGALLDLGRPGEALELTGEALASAPDDMVAHYLHGGALLGLGRAHQAVSHFERAAAAAPWFHDAHQMRGLALHRSGKTKAASASLQRALEIAPDSVACLLLAVEIDLKLRRKASARSNVERALALAPENPEAHVAAAIVELHARNRYRAGTSLRTALELDPENTNALNVLGVMEDSDDNPERALTLFERSSRIDARGRGPELHRRTSRRRHRVGVRVRQSRHTVWVIFGVLAVLSGIGRIATMPERDVYQPAPTTFTLPEPSKVPVSGPGLPLPRRGECEPWPDCVLERLEQLRGSIPVPSSTTTTWPSGG